MNNAREGHGVIIQQEDFIIIGGQSYKSDWEFTFNTERCSLQGGTMHCKDVGPVLTKYRFDLQLMHVPYDYCPTPSTDATPSTSTTELSTYYWEKKKIGKRSFP